MRILIIDECYYTRIGITEYLSSNKKLEFISVGCIDEAIHCINNSKPNIILVNLTYYCHHSNYCLTLKKLLSTSNEIRFYIYINALIQYLISHYYLKIIILLCLRKSLSLR